MATTATKNDPLAQVEQLNDQFRIAARKAGTWYLESYEKAVDGVIDLQHKLVDLTGQEWLSQVVEAQSDLTRKVVRAYTDTARSAFN